MADPLSITSSLTSILLVTGFLTRGLQSWLQAYADAPAEYLTLVDEVESTQHALQPLKAHLKAGQISPASRQIVVDMIAKIESMENDLFQQLESLLPAGGDSAENAATLPIIQFRARVKWIFNRNTLKELANNISKQKMTVLAFQVSVLSQEISLLRKEESGRLREASQIEESGS